MVHTIRIGSESSFTLLPEAERVRVFFRDIQQSSYSETTLRFIFELSDPDYDGGEDADVDTAIQGASENGYAHYENVNIPPGAIGKRTKLYKLLKGMSGGDFDEGTEVDLDQFVGEYYLIDFEHADQMRKVGENFVPVVENGKTMKKATIGKIRPVKRAKKAKAEKVEAAVIPDVPDDDDDLDLEEV